MSLKISASLSLPDEAVTQTFAILAQRRKGKTYTANVMAEEMVAAGIPWVALDPTGAWWGLRSSADGKKAGLPVYVFGGDHGDLPLERTAGKMIADLVVEHPGWYVLDFSHFESKEAERQLATDFAERFYRRKGTNKTPVHLFVDEADMFAPQRTPAGDQRMLGAFESIVRRGGIRGIGTTLITQRAAVLNKNVLEQIDVLIALRTVGPNDRKAIAGYVDAFATPEQQSELMGSIASLDLGEAYVWEPGADLFKRIKIRKRHTFNSSATPKTGDVPQEIVTLAKVDLEKIRNQMAETIQQVKSNDPTELKRQINELNRQLADRKPQVEIVEKTVEAMPRALLLEISGAMRDIEKLTSKVDRLLVSHQEKAAPLVGDSVGAPDHVIYPNGIVSRGSKGYTKRVKMVRDQFMALGSSDQLPKITGGAQRMLDVLGSRYPMTFTKSQLAALSKMSPRSGTFGTYMSLLRSNKLIEVVDNQISLTDEGRKHVGDVSSVPQTPEAVIDMWRNNLNGGARRMFESLVDYYPAALSKAELGESAEISPTSGTFGTYMSMLKRNGLIEVSGGEVRASDSLFVKGV